MKRSMVSVMILAAVLAFLYVPIILVVVYGFVPNGISMSFFGSDGSFLGFTGKWYKYIFTGHQSVRSLLESFWLSLIIAGLSTLASCAIGTTSALALHKWKDRLQSVHHALVYTPLIMPDILAIRRVPRELRLLDDPHSPHHVLRLVCRDDGACASPGL